MNRTLLPSAVLLALAPILAAQEQVPEKPALPDEVRVLIEKIEKLAEVPTEYDIVLSMELEMQGMQMKLDGSGHALTRDKTHMRSTMTMTISMDLMPEPMNMEVLTVADGTTLWIEVENPMMGGKQVQKVSVKQMEELQQSGMGMGMGSGGSQLDQVREMFEKYYRNFEVEHKDGVTRINGDVSPEIAESNPQFAELEISRFRMVFDDKSGFPIETAMGDGTKDFFVIKMSGVSFPKPEDIDAQAFVYQVPAGVAVQDLGAMLGAGKAADGGTDDSDF